MPKAFVFKVFGFLFLSKTRKTKKPQFFIGFFPSANGIYD